MNKIDPNSCPHGVHILEKIRGDKINRVNCGVCLKMRRISGDEDSAEHIVMIGNRINSMHPGAITSVELRESEC